MKQALWFLLIVGITTILAGCKLAVIVVEGGEVQSRFGTCFERSVCIVEGLPRENTAEQFTAVPNPGWFFHKWYSGERFICSDSALPVCELNFSAIEDDRELMEELRASSEIFYLMPVFKEYPRVTLGSEPRTIIVDGQVWQWRQPADFIGRSYDQVAEVCPENVCSGLLIGGTAGSTVSLDGHFWASSDDVELLALAYHQAGKSLLEDFRETFPTPSGGAVIGLVSDPPKGPEEIVTFGGSNRQSIGASGDISRSESIHIAGVWFWRPMD